MKQSLMVQGLSNRFYPLVSSLIGKDFTQVQVVGFDTSSDGSYWSVVQGTEVLEFGYAEEKELMPLLKNLSSKYSNLVGVVETIEGFPIRNPAIAISLFRTAQYAGFVWGALTAMGIPSFAVPQTHWRHQVFNAQGTEAQVAEVVAGLKLPEKWLKSKKKFVPMGTNKHERDCIVIAYSLQLAIKSFD